MTFKSVLGAALVVAGAATALAAPAAADDPTETDQQFLAALAEHHVRVGTDSKAISMAQSMCRKLGNGGDKGVEKALYYIKDNTDLSNTDITTFAGIAAQAYCADKVRKASG